MSKEIVMYLIVDKTGKPFRRTFGKAPKIFSRETTAKNYVEKYGRFEPLFVVTIRGEFDE